MMILRFGDENGPKIIRALEFGGAEGDRTLDLCIANAALSQLSYRPTRTACAGLVRREGANGTVMRPTSQASSAQFIRVDTACTSYAGSFWQ